MKIEFKGQNGKQSIKMFRKRSSAAPLLNAKNLETLRSIEYSPENMNITATLKRGVTKLEYTFQI